MDKIDTNIASFVVRFTQEVWQDSSGSPHVQWRGLIRHVQGSEEDRFTSFTEAVAFIQRNLTNLTLNTIAGKNMNQEEALRESFKFWEDFSTAYNGLMFEALEHGFKQSGAVKKQMDEAIEQVMKAWQIPIQPDSNQAELIEAINGLQKQVGNLTKKVERLESMATQKQTTNNSTSLAK